MKKQNGITLIGLVITIIVLLILAGVSISMVIGENGVLNQADTATVATREASAKEEIELAWASADAEYWNTWVNNSSENKEDYFTKENLNQYLDGKGEVKKVTNNGDGTYTVKYESFSDNMLYEIKIDTAGNATVVENSVHITQQPGLYDENNQLIADWNVLVDEYGLDIEADRTSYNEDGNMYSVLNNNPNLSAATKIVLPNSITKIGQRAFYLCPNLTSIVIPSSVNYIGKYAFASSKLTTIEIPNSIISIDEYAFNSCFRLTSVTIPDSVTSISNHAFSNCRNLISVDLGNGVKSINAYTFSNCNSLTSINLGSGVEKIEKAAFINCNNLKSIYISSNVTTIPATSYSNGPFYNCSSLKIYCESNSKQSGWGTYWNYYSKTGKAPVTYGVTRAEYEANYKQ